jgi:eukaryotic-like serine/threonine-protein kinase
VDEVRLDIAEVASGEVLAGKYRIERKLGEGGMGVVYAATHLALDQPVALKLLRTEMASHPEVAERFQREARAAAMIKSEHVARVLDVSILDSGEPYMVMEYLEGRDLEKTLEEDGPLTVARAASVIVEACHPLAEAHAQGIVHRDLKPANLFLAKQPGGRMVLKVLDFGISKATKDSKKLTATSVIMGTPYYMSPEQIRTASDVDARSDVWALGVILYELVSGTLPFVGDNAASIIAAISMDAAIPLRQVAPGAPEGLARICDKCLLKDRDYRYRDVGELARALLPFTLDGDASKERVAQIERILGRSGEDPALGTAETLRPPSLVDAEERAERPALVTAVANVPKLAEPAKGVDATPPGLRAPQEDHGTVSGVSTRAPMVPEKRTRRATVALTLVAIFAAVSTLAFVMRKNAEPVRSGVEPAASSVVSVAPVVTAPLSLPSATLLAATAPTTLLPLASASAPAPSTKPPVKLATPPRPSQVASAPPPPSASPTPNIHTMSGLK